MNGEKVVPLCKIVLSLLNCFNLLENLYISVLFHITNMIPSFEFKKLVHKLHLDKLYKSLKECHNDNRGGFLIPTSSKITDSEYAKYRCLPVNWSLPPITKEDLPDEFSVNAVKTVDMFRRKTIDLTYECMIYFDYKTGNIVSCSFSDKNHPNEVNGIIYPYLLKKMNIASIHNHPIQYGTPPSGKNFEMLSLEFEEFELISSREELWILESREKIFSDDEIRKIRENIGNFYNSLYLDINFEFDEGYRVIEEFNKRYGDFLLNYLNNKYTNIKLIRRYLND